MQPPDPLSGHGTNKPPPRSAKVRPRSRKRDLWMAINDPALFESTAQYMEDSLFGNQNDRMEKSLHTIVYSKTLKWKEENEYPLPIPLVTGEQDWNLLPYHPDEIAEVYLGAKASDDFKAEIVGLAQAVNPQIKIFDMTVDADGKLLSHLRS